jgi:hypothetical protein
MTMKGTVFCVVTPCSAEKSDVSEEHMASNFMPSKEPGGGGCGSQNSQLLPICGGNLKAVKVQFLSCGLRPVPSSLKSLSPAGLLSNGIAFLYRCNDLTEKYPRS